MAGWKTLIYSPEARIIIEDVDVSRDLVRGSVARIVDGASHLEFTLSNKGGRYNNKFLRMDRVTCWLSRLQPTQVFSGYLDSVPVLQMHPDFVTFKATCTIKRIIYTLWDPGLPASQLLLNQDRIPWGQDGIDGEAGGSGGTTPADDQGGLVDDILGQPAPDTATDAPAGSLEDLLQPGLPDDPVDNPAPNTDEPADVPYTGTMPNESPLYSQSDSGLGILLREVLVKVGGWDPDDIKIQKFPESFLGYVEERMPDIQNLHPDAEKAFKELFEYDEAVVTGGGGGGGGGLGEATFTTIGPPANGTNYSDDEIVWIVKNGGWSGEDVAIGGAIIKAESSGRPGASNLNSNGTYDRGLWQINDVHNDKLPGQDRMDPAVSTQLARMIYNESGGWTPWSTYSYHGTYSQHMDSMRAAAARGGTPPPNSGTKAPGGSPNAGPVDERPKPTTPPTQGGQADPNAPNTSGMSIQEAIVAVTKYKFPGPPFPDQGLGNAGRFAVSSLSRSEPGSEHDYSANRAVDLAQGTQNSTPDMQELARWWKQNYMGKGILELIHDGPNNAYNDQDAGDGMGIYGASTMAQHRDHVHIAMSTVVSPDGTSMPTVGGGGGGTGAGGAPAVQFDNRLAKNIFTWLFKPSTYNDKMSTLLTGRFATLNDVSLLTTVRALCEAGMRSFQSGPDGTFLAFYPDYWGIDGTAPKLRLEDIETINFRIDANDDAMVTHVFTRGADGIMGDYNDASDLGFMQSSGVVTIEDKWLFDRAVEGFYYPPEFDNAEDMLRRFGPRKIKENYPNIYMRAHPETMLLIAIKVFMKKWAQQFQTRVEFTFMPELFPGMRVEVVGHDLVVYVESVTHQFDYQQGFRTTAQVMAPMRLSKQPRNDRPEDAGPSTPQGDSK